MISRQELYNRRIRTEEMSEKEYYRWLKYSQSDVPATKECIEAAVHYALQDMNEQLEAYIKTKAHPQELLQ